MSPIPIASRKPYRLPAMLLALCMFVAAPARAAEPTGADTPALDPEVAGEVSAFLRDYYTGFERADLAWMDAGMTEDFTATFIIPSRGKDPIHYDRAGLMEGLRKAFAYYAGRQPRMEIRDVVVLARGRDEAVAFFSMHFHLGDRWIDAALSIADLRREDGRWKLYRLYENKRK